MQPNSQPSWFCPSCGHQNQLSFKFCTDCGTALPLDAATSQTAVPSKTPRTFAPAVVKTSNGFLANQTIIGGVIVLFVALGLILSAFNSGNGAGKLRPLESSLSSGVRQERRTDTPSSMSGEPEVAPMLVATAGSSSGVTMENYNRIQTGMAYSDVVQILGKAGTELSSNDIAGYRTIMYQWQGYGIANMNVMFQNGKMIQKAQFGLK